MELGVSITRSATETYDFLSVPENFGKWKWGPGVPLRPAGGDWVADTVAGRVAVRLSERNSFGVLDYSVTLPSGIRVYVPLRVVATRGGCELVSTLFRRPDVANDQVAVAAEALMRDLRAAKRILEAR
jgi:hypothetical protein